MIEISHDTLLIKLNELKIGDKVIDSYESSGRITKIAKSIKDEFIEFRLLLDSGQTIFLMSSLI